MKKILVLILALSYLASTSGATVYIHQCMGKTIGWDITGNENNNCAKCGMHKNAPNDCCQDHMKVIKVHNDQNLPQSLSNKIFLPNFILPTASYSLDDEILSEREKISPLSYTPLRSRKIDYCTLYCTFLI